MSTLILVPVLVPLLCLVLSLVTGRRFQTALAYLGPLGVLVSGLLLLLRVREEGIAVVQLGQWPAPVGITFMADQLSAILVSVTGLVALACGVFGHTEVTERDIASGRHPLVHALLLGVVGAFLTGDLFNLYVWFEVLLLSSFGLMVRRRDRRELAGTARYLILSLLSSFLFLCAIALVYATVGTLNMADISRSLEETPRPVQATLIGAMLTLAFGIKAGLFPFFAWLPASYPLAAPSLAALFAGLLTKVGVYSILRTFTLILPPGTVDAGVLGPLLVGAAVLTMGSGVLAAATQFHVRRILSFHISSQIGYMIMGIALLTPLALAGTVFYLVHHIVTKTALFLVAGVLKRRQGSEDLDRLGGVWAASPLLGLAFLLPALSLAGVPPFSGFWAKLFLLRSGVEAGAWLLVAVAAATGLWTVFSMTKIWAEAFWRPAPDESASKEQAVPTSMYAPLGALALLTVLFGVAAGPLFQISQDAARELLDPSLYQAAVLLDRGAS